MCGIVGYITAERSDSSSTVIQRMTDVLSHRGPDDAGVYADAHATLGHRRLSIIDLDAGHQPMANEDGTLWITYNGELYNHTDLRPELMAAGYRYKTHCDTETILHSYEQYGADCLHRFRGMFSFAIWDKSKKQLFCARDRLGIKPFYYYWDGRCLVFASEIKALLCHPGVSAELNTCALPEYLAFGYLSGEQTMFRGIRKLMPGHHLTLTLESVEPRMEIRQYWDVPITSPRTEICDGDLIHECRRRLEETVKMHLMSDVPLGMFLSGGVDSSAITALMRRMTSGPVKTFSVGYDDAAHSELKYAQQVATAIGTDHHTVRITREEFFSTLSSVIWHEDEPSVFSSSVPLYFLSKRASQEVKVVLSGEGSDELFGGYERYGYYAFNASWASRYSCMPAGLRTAIRRQIDTAPLLPGDLRRKLQHTFIGRANTFEALQLENFYCAFSESEIAALIEGNAISSGFGNVMKYWQRWEEASALTRMLYTDQKTYLVELLMRQDQMSMAFSLESRVPFLDHTFVEFAMQVPDQLRIRKGERKYIFKQAVEDLLPRDIVYRKKMGFPTPLRTWLRESAAEPIFAGLLRKEGLLASVLDMAGVKELIRKHRNGVEDGTDRIWRLLNLQIWGDMFLDGSVATSRPISVPAMLP
jgi:asparagine synthase (glutamine-hydrolysing)